ncbi:MAG: cyclodeaminase/cyclohydrolase family protein [Candidatus Omnitrophica bacterium]|nr:cyclodeaminase/cyclohydrolase family protein [Candidatus Omnitrophota bacterium]
MKKLFSEMTLSRYSEILGSSEPAPGGGSAAAYVGALGTSLGEMVANLNAKKSKNPDAAQCRERARQLQKIRERFLTIVTEDARAFEKVSALWKTPSPELQKALREAALVPMGICEAAYEALTVASRETPWTSNHLMSDLAECGLFLIAAFKGGRFNVEINLREITDTEFTEFHRARLDRLQKQVLLYGNRLEETFSLEIPAKS